jgi:hypothetical protein
MNPLHNVRRIESAEGIPDGTYRGQMSGNLVRFDTEYGSYEGTAKDGVRGLNVPCKVLVKMGEFEVVR